jgi:hypothetical protein
LCDREAIFFIAGKIAIWHFGNLYLDKSEIVEL